MTEDEKLAQLDAAGEAASGVFDPDTREICETLQQYLNERVYAGLASPGVISEVRPSADGSAAFALRWDDAVYVIEVRRSEETKPGRAGQLSQ